MPPLKSNGRILPHPREKAEALNNFYSNISSIDNNKNLPEHSPGPPVATTENIFITEQDVLDQLSNLNVNKPPDPDGVTPKLLKLLSSSICKPLIKLFNKSLKLKCLPYIWKKNKCNPCI